jgi:hypothetical protein
MENQLFIGIAFAAKPCIANEQVRHGKARRFVASITIRIVNLAQQIHQLTVIRSISCHCALQEN